MCDRPRIEKGLRGVRPLLAALLLATASPLEAQDRPDTAAVIERLEAELARLVTEMDQARERARLEDARLDSIRAARADVPHDTMRIGPLTVLATAERAEEARAGVGAAWRRVGPILRGRGASLSEAVLVVDPDRQLTALRPRGRTQRIFGRSWRTFVFDGGMLEEQAIEALAREASYGARRPLREWTDLSGIFEPAGGHDLEALYRRLILHPAPAMKGCLGGDTESCWTAMGLGRAEDPVEEWVRAERLEEERAGYTPGPLPSIGPARADRSVLDPWLRCQSEGAARCDAFFVGRTWMMAVPMPAELRTDLIAFALARGGSGSLDRLLSGWPPAAERDTEDPAYDRRVFASVLRARLAAASGLDESDLMDAWRDRIVTARPDLRAGADVGRFATFLWILLFAVFAARSTRWRLG